MKQLLWLALGVLVGSLVLFGCKGSDGSAGPQGPPGTALTGNYHGKVALYDATGSSYFNSSGVTVTAKGTAFSGVSDSIGKYVINGLPTGTYTLVFTKASFGTMEIQQVSFVGGGDFYNSGFTILSNLPSFEPLTATSPITAGTITLSGTVSGAPPIFRSVFIFIGRASGVSASDPQSYIVVYSAGIVSSDNHYTIDISEASLISNYGFLAGQTVYFAVYSVAPVNPSYFDYAASRSVYSAVGISPKSTSTLLP